MKSPASLLCFCPAFASQRSLLLPMSTLANFSGLYFIAAIPKEAKVDVLIRLRCTGLSQYTLPVTQWPDNVSKANKEDEGAPQVFELNEIKQRIDVIKANLNSMDDGEMSISAYDTAWVALVKDIHGSDVAPQFPSSLKWIIHNQLPDGSWGDRYLFSAYDRLISTLACVIALTSWNIYPKKCEKGMAFLRENVRRLKDENPEHMPIGFEISFPSLIEMAQTLGLQVPQDSHVLQHIYAKRERKLKRIPKEMMYKAPTPLLFSLEGMPGLDWKRLLMLQCPNGSIACSPSSTAFALMQTKDEKCLKYLNEIVERFDGGVPNCYPVDLFEHVWVVDRLDRLGISRYFKPEIKDCLDYVYRYWTPKGICWARNTSELCVDDTSMGFRILRLHGYKVAADTFQHFQREGEFFCLVGQLSQGVTGMLNLYRASQVLFPGEEILEEAKKFTAKFLREKKRVGQILDKWIITKDLVGEVQYALDVPWYASLPRIETRFYIEQYGGDDDVWIGKVLYRMYNVSNNLYLELAKLDYNRCQKLHQLEWIEIQRWYEDCNLGEFGFSKDGLLQAYFLAMSSIFEPDRVIERLAWARTAALMEAISFYFCHRANTAEQKRAFLQAFSDNINQRNNRRRDSKGTGNGLIEAILETLRGIAVDIREAHGKEVDQSLQHAWETWLLAWQTQELIPKEEAELLVCTINLSAGHSFLDELMSLPHYTHLTNLANEVCYHLRRTQNFKAGYMAYSEEVSINQSADMIESKMQELVQCVVQSTYGIDRDIKQTFLAVAKSFYYITYYEPNTIKLHITKLLFERLL